MQMAAPPSVPSGAAPPQGADQPPISPALEKALSQVMQGLGNAYMECHKASPDSPLCDAIMSLQKAVAEVSRNAGMPAADMQTAADAGAVPPDPNAQPPADAPPDSGPLPPGATIDDAAAATQQMMQDAAKRRQGA